MTSILKVNPPQNKGFSNKNKGSFGFQVRNESFIETNLFAEMMQLKVKPQAILQWPVSKKQVTSIQR